MSKHFDICIRVDGNGSVGIGHLMRCISLACACRDKGMRCLFIVSKDSYTELIENMRFDFSVVNYQYDDKKREIEIVTKKVINSHAKLTLVDSYYIDNTYLENIGKVCKTIYIDDLGMLQYQFDAVINYNFYANSISYPNKTIKLLGPKYFPIRNEFNQTKISIRKNVKKILVLAGGSDNSSVIRIIADTLMSYKSSNKIIIVKGSDCGRQQLEIKYSKRNNICFYGRTNSISKLMSQADIIISASGTTTYEIIALGIPCIFYTMADNQRQIGQYLKKNRIGIEIGSIFKKSASKKILQSLELLESQTERLKMHKKMKGLMDKEGANRVADVLKQLI